MKYIVSGIHTDAGKTVAAAVLTAGLGASYWKPVQAGTEPDTDSLRIKSYLGLASDRVLEEAYLLPYPESPHSSAKKAGVEIEWEKLQIPPVSSPLIIEGAGGLLVPINQDRTFLDLFQQWQLPVILVSRLYLGAINHTLLSVEALKSRNIPIKGILFNGESSEDAKQVILHQSKLKNLGHIPFLEHINPETCKAAFEKYVNKDLLFQE